MSLNNLGGVGLASVTADEKEENLRALLRDSGSVLIAYSGGVDSAYLAFVATEELGDKAVCATGVSPSVSQSQLNEARQIAENFGFNWVRIKTDELNDPNYQANPSNRCYFCKSELYAKLKPCAEERGIKTIFDGANADDVKDYRPGREAAKESGTRSPLIEVGLTKNEIRELSRKRGLPTWDKPASPCLSSRVAYGVPVTIERLSKIEKGEDFLRELGLREFRVRNHGELVRLEISPIELDKILSKDKFEILEKKFAALGFKYVTLDLKGYRSGAMNEVLNKT